MKAYFQEMSRENPLEVFDPMPENSDKQTSHRLYLKSEQEGIQEIRALIAKESNEESWIFVKAEDDNQRVHTIWYEIGNTYPNGLGVSVDTHNTRDQILADLEGRNIRSVSRWVDYHFHPMPKNLERDTRVKLDSKSYGCSLEYIASKDSKTYLPAPAVSRYRSFTPSSADFSTFTRSLPSIKKLLKASYPESTVEIEGRVVTEAGIWSSALRKTANSSEKFINHVEKRTRKSTQAYREKRYLHENLCRWGDQLKPEDMERLFSHWQRYSKSRWAKKQSYEDYADSDPCRVDHNAIEESLRNFFLETEFMPFLITSIQVYSGKNG